MTDLTSYVKRTFWKTNTPLSSNSGEVSLEPENDRYEVTSEDDATLIGSSTGVVTSAGPIHMPVIDIDLPCQLVPSSTEGHFHLYIDHPMLWNDYVHLLDALANAGIVEHGYVDASVNRGQTFVRKPGVTK